MSSFQHVTYKKELKVKPHDEDEWDKYSFHCGCPCDPYPDDPFCGYGPPDNDPNYPESEKLRKDPNKSCKKKCGKSKPKSKKSEGKKNLEALKIEMKHLVKEE
jgi:hypothetical protein